MITSLEIKNVRRMLNLTQYEFSVVLSFGSSSVSERTVQKWERGEFKPASSAESLVRILEILSVHGKITLREVLRKVGR